MIQITIEGTTPILMNRFHDAAQQGVMAGSSSSMLGSKGTPREQAMLKLYTGLDGNPIIPQPNLFRSIIDAGTFFKAGKSKVTTARSSMIPACLEIQGVELPLIHKEAWQVDSRAVCIPSTGGRIMCHRPRFDDWKIEFVLVVDTTMIQVKLVREIVDAAGKRIGLGDFRPSRKGPFGKFTVTSWQEIEQELKDAA
jgi:hypothetical protein